MRISRRTSGRARGTVVACCVVVWMGARSADGVTGVRWGLVCGRTASRHTLDTHTTSDKGHEPRRDAARGVPGESAVRAEWNPLF